MSRLIKSQWANPSKDDQRLISIKMLQMKTEDHVPVFAPLESQTEEILLEAKRNAEQIVDEATVQAQSIHEQILREKEAWQQEKLAIAENAKNEGYSIGFSEGKSQGYSEYKENIEFAKEVIDSSKNDYQQHIESAEKTILNLGIKVAEQILGLTVVDNENAFLSIVKRALKEAREYKEVQIHVNPSHYGFILSQKEELQAIFPKEADIYIYPDEDLSNQSCIIESANGRIDASIDSQLGELKRKLTELLESESE